MSTSVVQPYDSFSVEKTLRFGPKSNPVKKPNIWLKPNPGFDASLTYTYIYTHRFIQKRRLKPVFKLQRLGLL